jgi:hypothetical protein
MVKYLMDRIVLELKHPQLMRSHLSSLSWPSYDDRQGCSPWYHDEEEFVSDFSIALRPLPGDATISLFDGIEELDIICAKPVNLKSQREKERDRQRLIADTPQASFVRPYTACAPLLPMLPLEKLTSIKAEHQHQMPRLSKSNLAVLNMEQGKGRTDCHESAGDKDSLRGHLDGDVDNEDDGDNDVLLQKWESQRVARRRALF